MKIVVLIVAIAGVSAVALSAIWGVPYIFTFIAFAALVVVSQVVTIDDDLPGGWSNPHGTEPFPWAELLTKAAILAALVLLAFWPAVRALGR